MRWLLPIVLVACGGSMSGSSNSTGSGGGNTQTLVVQAGAGQPLSIAGPGGMLQLGAYQYSYDSYGGSMLTQVSVNNWSSAATGVATVDKTGLVTAVSSGTAMITANSDMGTGSATVTVGMTMSSSP
ncbi:MAG TPA: Ig-like domain-containing protein [Myxococcales bacterium]|nr:Ig-like domain-containing protein [Myxococcales bacterium]